MPVSRAPGAGRKPGPNPYKERIRVYADLDPAELRDLNKLRLPSEPRATCVRRLLKAASSEVSE